MPNLLDESDQQLKVRIRVPNPNLFLFQGLRYEPGG